MKVLPLPRATPQSKVHGTDPAPIAASIDAAFALAASATHCLFDLSLQDVPVAHLRLDRARHPLRTHRSLRGEPAAPRLAHWLFPVQNR